MHQQIWSLRRQGYSGKAIAQKLGISCTTVFVYLRSPTFRERQGRSDRGRSKLDPYKDYLRKQWNEKCYQTKQLFFEIQKQGYSGSYDTVARYTRRLRQATGIPVRPPIIERPSPQVVAPLRCALTPRQVTSLVMQRKELLGNSKQQLITLLKNRSFELKEAIELAEDFTSLVRQLCPEQLDSWLKRAINSCCSQQ